MRFEVSERSTSSYMTILNGIFSLARTYASTTFCTYETTQDISIKDQSSGLTLTFNQVVELS